jgi:iron complex outermembrane recepter protein
MRSLSGWVSGLALAVAAPLAAEELSLDAAQAEDYAEILVTGQRTSADTALTFGEPIKEVPLTVNVVSEELIEKVSAQRLRDLFVYIPGVDATETNGATGDSIVIRGFQTTRRFSLNGLRRPLNFDNQTTDLETIERVEIVKGPAGLEFGVTDPGGSVNFVTKKPQDRFAAVAEANYGSFDTFDISADLTGPMAEGVSGRLVAHYANADSFRDTLDSERLTVAPSVKWDYAEGGSLLVETSYTYQDLSYDRGTFYLEGAPADAGFDGNFAPIERSFHEPTDRLPSHIFRGAAYLQQRLMPGLNLNLSVDGVLDDYESYGARNPNLNGLYAPGTNRWNGTNRTVQRGFVTFNANREAYVAQADLDGELGVGAFDLSGRVGVTHSELTGTNRGVDGQTRWNIDAFAPVYGTTPMVIGTPATIGRNFVSVDDIRETGFFTSGKVEFAERARLFAGYRRDDFRSRNDYTDNVTRGTPTETTVVDNRADAWRVGGSFDVTDAITLFAGASRSEIPQTGRLRDTGAVVAPLEATSYEAGLKAAKLGGRVSGTLSVFEITQDNQTVADPLNRPGESFVENIGEVRVRGAEAELSADVGAGLMLFAGGSYLDSEIRTLNPLTGAPGAQFGNRFFNVPKWDGFARATWDAGTAGVEGLSLAAAIIHSGDRFGNNANTFVLPSFTRVDAGIYYDWRNLGFKLTAENLFDETYYLGSQNRPQNIAPGAPRTVTAGISVRW